MAEIGLFLSSEEHGPKALLDQAKRGEEAGFSSVFISDHFHPWVDDTGREPLRLERHRRDRRRARPSASPPG